jgi:hypothetical protein
MSTLGDRLKISEAASRAVWTHVGYRRGWHRPPREPRLEMRRIDHVAPLVSPPPVSSLDGGLYAPPRPRHQIARSASIDRLLKSMGVQPRRAR